MIDTWQSSVNTSKKPSEAVTRRCSVKKVFLEHRKTHVPEPPFLKMLKAQECNFIKKENLAQVFSCQFAKFLRTPFLTEHPRWLLLSLVYNPRKNHYFLIIDYRECLGKCISCTHYLWAVITFYDTGSSKSAFSTYYFGKLVFCLSVLNVFPVCSEFSIRCLTYRIYNIYIGNNCV